MSKTSNPPLQPSEPALTLRRWPTAMEWIALAALLMIFGVACWYRLSELLVPEMDEGIYVYGGKLVSQGSVPYRDFMFGHPPLVLYVSALFWRVGGSLAGTRALSIVLTGASTLPLFLLARRMASSTAAGLATVALYLAGLLCIANLGRTMRIETPLNALLIAATSAWWLGRGKVSAVASGALFAGAFSAKLIAAVPLACFAAAEVVWPIHGRADWRRRTLMVLGFALVFVPIGLWCLGQSGFVEWVFRAQVARMRVPLGPRLAALGQALVRYPPLGPGFIVAAVQIRSTDPVRRSLAVGTLGSAAAAIFLFKTFFRHYIVLALPWLAVLLAVVAAEALTTRTRRAILATLAFGLAGAAPVTFTLLALRASPQHSRGAATVFPYLQPSRGYLFSPYPDFALLSGRELLPWYFAIDYYLGLTTGRLTDVQFAAAASKASTVVVYEGELDALPATRAMLDSRFRALAVDSHWQAWEVRDLGSPAEN